MSDDSKNISIDTAAEQWVRLVLAHIQAKKQIANTPPDKKKEEQE